MYLLICNDIMLSIIIIKHYDNAAIMFPLKVYNDAIIICNAITLLL